MSAKDTLREIAEAQGIDIGIPFFKNYTEDDAEKFLGIIDTFENAISDGDLSFALVVYKKKEFLFYNRKYSVNALITDEPKVMLSSGNSPDVIYFGQGIVPLAFPTKCKVHTSVYLQRTPNNNLDCPVSGCPWWFCTTCNAWKNFSPDPNHSV